MTPGELDQDAFLRAFNLAMAAMQACNTRQCHNISSHAIYEANANIRMSLGQEAEDWSLSRSFAAAGLLVLPQAGRVCCLVSDRLIEQACGQEPAIWTSSTDFTTSSTRTDLGEAFANLILHHNYVAQLAQCVTKINQTIDLLGEADGYGSARDLPLLALLPVKEARCSLQLYTEMGMGHTVCSISHRGHLDDSLELLRPTLCQWMPRSASQGVDSFIFDHGKPFLGAVPGDLCPPEDLLATMDSADCRAENAPAHIDA